MTNKNRQPRSLRAVRSRPLALACTSLVCTLLVSGCENSIEANPAIPLTLRSDIPVTLATASSQAIVNEAQAFLATLSNDQRAAAVFAFNDNQQRANWSNFPHPVVSRAGIMIADMTEAQNNALHRLLKSVMSESGYQNILYQLAADEASDEGDTHPLFGEEYYFISFLGEPSTQQPWMLQFGGHHLAINATFVGSDVSFSPMMTGGEPLHIQFNNKAVFITEQELKAATRLLKSLSSEQQAVAIRSSRTTDLISGPGQFGVTPVPEGIKGSELTAEQQGHLKALVASRVGMIYAEAADKTLDTLYQEINETYFGWWGPQTPMGEAYYRITGPNILMEYSPEESDQPADHAHNMYRNPKNDYGAQWITQ
ncbi:MAG: DUF3500 domain-containing protein [Pontibacterium sp.]